MIKRKNKICLIFFIVALVLIFLAVYNYIDNSLLDDNSIHYNIISYASIIGGFLFTGLGILISTIDKERIKRLWENNYLDNLYIFSILGIILNAIAIIIAILIILFDCIFKTIYKLIISVEVTCVLSGFITFIISALYLAFIIKRLKPQ
ncbi:MAG: hypothetical protein ACI4JM_02985 [Oscillospiraceae bacterium]